MNINIKNCKVSLYTGTETINLNGECEQTDKPDTGVISIQRTYTIAGFMANRDKVKTGDHVKLPAFTVPAAKMDGKEVLSFEEKHIDDEAVVIGKDEKGNFILIFNHCLFESAMDLNDEKRFEMTQLGQYLQSEFLRAMQSAGIPAGSCGLISNEEMFGENPLEYFKAGRNRIAFDFDDDCSRSYWLSTFCEDIASSAIFCLADYFGNAYFHLRGQCECVCSSPLHNP